MSVRSALLLYHIFRSLTRNPPVIPKRISGGFPIVFCLISQHRSGAGFTVLLRAEHPDQLTQLQRIAAVKHQHLIDRSRKPDQQQHSRSKRKQCKHDLPPRELSEDQVKDLQDELQKMTDKYIKEIEAAVTDKSAEIMKV